MTYVCPKCKGVLELELSAYFCQTCKRRYPVLFGIPDFRLFPDPYISIENDHSKAAKLLEHSEEGFLALVRYYYSITPEVPKQMAERWAARAAAQVEIARAVLVEGGLQSAHKTRLLDVGCATGAMLIAARSSFNEVVGVDIAFRWLAVGSVRLRESGCAGKLVCANAEALPFPPGTFDAVTATDVIEHVQDANACFEETRRVSVSGGTLVCTTMNRYSPVIDPHAGLWGVGILPRRFQPAYVARRRNGMHAYQVRMRSSWELGRLLGKAKYRRVYTQAETLQVPHRKSGLAGAAIALYNQARQIPGAGPLFRFVGPRLIAVAEA